MLTFRFSGTDGAMTETETLTSGMVGKQVRLEFSPDWDDLTKTVVFSNGSVTLDSLYAHGCATIPAQILEKPLKTLTVGVFGVSNDGNVVIPTVRAVGPEIQPGADPAGDSGTDPALPVWAQLQAVVGQPTDLITHEKRNLVDAINEVAQRPAGDGATFTPSVSADGILSWTNDKGLDNPDAVSVTGPQGADGRDGRIIAQPTPPEDTSVLWVDTGDDTVGDAEISNPLFGKFLALNGDSICAGSGETLGGYGKIIADRNHMAYQNIAKGGATITAELYSSTTGDPYHWISRTVENLDETADYIIVEGGVNDYWKPAPLGTISEGCAAALDESTFYGAFESMLKQLLARFPGKKIGYIIVHKTYAQGMWRGGDYHTAAVACCEKWGVPYLDLSVLVPPFAHIPSMRAVYTTNDDGTHPTVEGYNKFYCDKIEAWLKTL